METQYKLLDVWKIETVDLNMEERKRQQAIKEACTLSEKPFPCEICTLPMPMKWWEEAIVCLICFIFFGSLLYGPFLFIALAYFNLKYAITLAIILTTLVAFPRDIFLRSACFSYIATLILRYFSYRGAWKDFMPTGRSLMLVAPPHGLFPIGILIIFTIL